MLIISRRPGETLTIGNAIEVTILGIKGNQVRVGINAPEDVLVLREELEELPMGPAPHSTEHARLVPGN